MADVDTWLLVFAGATDWGHIVAQGVTSVRSARTDAYHMLFLEVGATAKRSSVLLVHQVSGETRCSALWGRTGITVLSTL